MTEFWLQNLLLLLTMIYQSKCRTREVVRGRAFDKVTMSTALAGALEITFSPPARLYESLLSVSEAVRLVLCSDSTQPSTEVARYAG